MGAKPTHRFTRRRGQRLRSGRRAVPFAATSASSTAALVLVIPVVVGAVIGGFGAGAVQPGGGFLDLRLRLYPALQHLSVGTTQNWTALVVYVVVMLLVARVVDVLDATRIAAERGEEVMRRVSEVSELLVGDQPVEELLRNIVATARTVFGVPGVSLLELEDGRPGGRGHRRRTLNA